MGSTSAGARFRRPRQQVGDLEGTGSPPRRRGGAAAVTLAIAAVLGLASPSQAMTRPRAIVLVIVDKDGLREFKENQQFALYDGRAKLIVSPHKTELYDLRQDPGETVDLSAGRETVMASLKRRLAEVVSGLGDSAKGVSETEVLQVLKSLGYVQ